LEHPTPKTISNRQALRDQSMMTSSGSAAFVVAAEANLTASEIRYVSAES
jgi:hypothetical protein